MQTVIPLRGGSKRWYPQFCGCIVPCFEPFHSHKMHFCYEQNTREDALRTYLFHWTTLFAHLVDTIIRKTLLSTFDMAAQEDSKGAQVYISDNNSSEVKIDGSLEFVHEYGGNNSKPSYQEASGAPVENVSPLGLEVGWFTTIFLNIGQMIGTGVFSTRMLSLTLPLPHNWCVSAASILKGVGSVGLSLIFWVLGFLIAASQLSVFVELATFFPNRSGAEVVYLEQAYPRPKYLMPTAFAVQSVLLSFSSSNCIGKHGHSIGPCQHLLIFTVMAQYLYATGGHTPSDWELKGLATACFTFIVLGM